MYNGTTVVCKDMELVGKVIVIKGENGKGKSTLLKAVSGLISYVGTINNQQSISYMKEMVCFPQGITLAEFFELMVRFEDTDLIAYQQLIQLFDLSDKLDSQMASLSKGMTMKVNVIITLMIDRDLYVLDEPFSGLDKTGVTDLIEYILESKKDFLLSTHIKNIPKRLYDMEVIL